MSPLSLHQKNKMRKLNSKLPKCSDLPPQDGLQQLEAQLERMGSCAIAVSGGIDSTLLAVIAGRMNSVDMEVHHAVSPAVPERATERVRAYALAENWRLTIADAGEFKDSRYVDNPLNRCYFCKVNLYSHIARQSTKLILSGTNLDDLEDFRPGLKAADQHAVRHPYVEANVAKSDIRRFAEFLQLDDLADLPASPCLSSRVQTGTPIKADWLKAIDQVEIEIQRVLKAKTVRCRIQSQAIVIELDTASLDQVDELERTRLSSLVRQSFSDSLDQYPVYFAPYRMGSAFVASPE